MSLRFKVLTFFVVLILIFTAVFLFARKKITVTEKMAEIITSQTERQDLNQIPLEISHQAKFLIFTNGTKRVFSDPKYHNKSENVFITSQNPEVIHIKESEITWGNFFDSLPSPMKMENNCLYTGTGQVFCNSDSHSLKFFLNGVKIDQVLGMEIKDGDKLLVSYGPKDEDITEQINSF